MAEAALKRSLEKPVAERVKSEKCLHCDRQASRRGLCGAHYMQFRRTQSDMPKSERGDFELEAIREGRILAVGKIREIKKPNPFAA